VIKLKAINRLIFTVTLVVYLMALLIYGIWDYSYHKTQIIENIDKELYNSAVALKYILPEDFHDRAIDEQAISTKEDKYIAHKLTKFIKETGLKYAYTIVEKGGALFFVASDLPVDFETKRGTYYFYPYEEADESFVKAFDQEKPTFKTVSDQWGTVRTVIVPEKSPGGIKYLACADFDISYVDGVLRSSMWRSIASVLFLLLLSLPIIIFYIRLHREYWDSLQESEEKYRSIFENAVEGFFQSTPEGSFINVNPALAKMFGYKSPEEIICIISDISKQFYVNTEDRINFQETLLRVGSVENYEYMARRKDGSHIWISSSARAVYDDNATVIHFEGNVNDITERKQSEEALKDSEKRYRTLFEKSTDAIFIIERSSGRYLDANEAALRLSGRKLSDLKNLSTRDTTPDNFRERLYKIDKTITPEDLGRVTYMRPDGTQRVALLTSVPLDSEAVIGIARDITDELEMEHQLRQAQKMEAIGTLAGGIAHDFNNILSAILGYSELALAELPPEAAIRNKLEAIHSSGERARDLVTQILTFSRKDEQVRFRVELDLILKDALKLLRPAIPTTIDIKTQIASNCHVLGDPSRLDQIIMNLCTNAYQAMLEAGGTLTISLSEVKVEGRAAALTRLPSGSYGKLVISDTGGGSPSENLERIFDPYFTTKEKGKGTGLGLAAVHGIIKSHGGSILVESQVGQGTSFEVYLPLTWEGSATEEPAETQIVGGNESILIVDDEADILEIEKEMLETLGYNITTQRDSQEALSLFAKQPERFDLVITDMTMSGLTGDKLSAELLKIRLDIPIILCTGYSELMSQEKASSLGIKGFLLKPIKMRDLSEMIRNVLDTVNRR